MLSRPAERPRVRGLAGFGDVDLGDDGPDADDLEAALDDDGIVPLVRCRRCGRTVAHRLAPAGVATLVLCGLCRAPGR